MSMQPPAVPPTPGSPSGIPAVPPQPAMPTPQPKPPSLAPGATPPPLPPVPPPAPIDQLPPVSFWQQPFAQNVLPLLTSLVLHIGLILVVWATVQAVQAVVTVVQQQIIIPES